MDEAKSNPGGADRVLFVDDEVNILRSIERGLGEVPFEKIFVTSAKDALDWLDRMDFNVIVTDVRMPEMDGLELLRIAKHKHPEIVRIVLTGFAHVYTIIPAINSGEVFRYLTKPWKMDAEFLPAIKQAIEYNHLLVERGQMFKRLSSQNELLDEQNKQILDMLGNIQKSDDSKSKLLNYLIQDLTPFLKDLDRTLEFIGQTNDPQINEFLRMIHQKARTISHNLQSIDNLMTGK
jgi:two-component system, NtrC family, response regulator HupR/HoxA